MVAAVICLLVVSLIAAGLVQSLLIDHRLADRQLTRVQALWLAEAAQQFAHQRLAADRDYEGETRRLGLAQFGSLAEADIRIQTTAPDASHRRIVVEVRWPADQVDQALEKVERLIRLETPDDSSSDTHSESLLENREAETP